MIPDPVKRYDRSLLAIFLKDRDHASTRILTNTSRENTDIKDRFLMLQRK
jgi:hypothetical protein